MILCDGNWPLPFLDLYCLTLIILRHNVLLYYHTELAKGVQFTQYLRTLSILHEDNIERIEVSILPSVSTPLRVA